MINWANLPIDSINGLTGNEVGFLSELSMGGRDEANDDQLMEFIRFLENDNLSDHDQLGDNLLLPDEEPSTEQSTNQTNEPGPSTASDANTHGVCFADVDAMDTAVLQALPRTTREQMLEHGDRFARFVKMRSNTADLSTMESTMLNEYLRFFYYTLETKQGTKYSPASLVCIRAGIQRYFEFYLKRRVNLKTEDCFASSNRMLEMKAKEFVAAGGDAKHYVPIEPKDMEKLMRYFKESDGKISSDERLQDEVFFTLMYTFGERGQEHVEHLMKKDGILFALDSEGREYAYLPPLPSKNRGRMPLKRGATADAKQVRMYDTAVLKRYLDRLPATTKDACLFPKPLKGEGKGFSTMVNRGKNYWNNFMKTLSTKAGLHKQYTNHCVRVTRICDLHSIGHSVEEIMAVTGHKCEKSVRGYLKIQRDPSLYRAAMAVHSALHGERMQSESGPTEKRQATQEPSSDVLQAGSPADTPNQIGRVEEQQPSTEVRSQVFVATSKPGPSGFQFSGCEFNNCSFVYNQKE